MLSSSVFAKLQPGLFPSFPCRRLPAVAGLLRLPAVAGDPLTLLFATHTDSTSCKSFLCHSYENSRGVYQLFPFWNCSQPNRSRPNHHLDKKPLAATPLESALIEVVILKNLKLLRMNTYKKHRGWGGHPLQTLSIARTKPTALSYLGLRHPCAAGSFASC
jgi:hypothetical protein